MNTYPVVESFISINGEGPRAGQLSFFIRLKGCNLSCSYCDTKWANQTNAPVNLLTAKQLYDKITESGISNVTLTGGEPLLQPHMEELLQTLSSIPHCHIEIETNGSIDISPFASIANNISFTIDYKLPDSGMEPYMYLPNFMPDSENESLLTQNDAIKFVVSGYEDLKYAYQLIHTYHLTEQCKVYFSPVYQTIEPKEVVEFMKRYQINDVHLQLQLHKFIWSPDTKGV